MPLCQCNPLASFLGFSLFGTPRDKAIFPLAKPTLSAATFRSNSSKRNNSGTGLIRVRAERLDVQWPPFFPFLFHDVCERLREGKFLICEEFFQLFFLLLLFFFLVALLQNFPLWGGYIIFCINFRIFCNFLANRAVPRGSSFVILRFQVTMKQQPGKSVYTRPVFRII